MSIHGMQQPRLPGGGLERFTVDDQFLILALGKLAIKIGDEDRCKVLSLDARPRQT